MSAFAARPLSPGALARPPAAVSPSSRRSVSGQQQCCSARASGTHPGPAAPVIAGSHAAPSTVLRRTACTAAAAGDAGGSSASSAPQQFSLLRIAGDGACLFRSLAQGAHLAVQEDAAALDGSGSSAPQLLSAERETVTAGELRAAICQELLNRREELCFFIDGDYDAYVARMQLPHTWGGEPELAVATHVLRRPVAVYMLRHTGLQQISCYGEGQHGSATSVPLLFHGGGHYDLLLRQPAAAAPRSRL